MPLTIRNYTNDLFSPSIFDIRNDCTKINWKIGENQLVGNKLDMIILRYETGVGAIPPVKSYDQLCKEFKRSQKTPPEITDTAAIREALVTRMQTWAYIWFIPVFVPGTDLDELAKSGAIPTDCIWGTFIKSRSLDGTKTTGLWKHADTVAGMKKDLTDVISCPRFAVTHQQGGSGGDCYGLVWSSREPSDAEKERLGNARTYVESLVKDNRVESVLRLPSIANEQFTVIEDDGVRSLSATDIHEAKKFVLCSSLGQSQFGATIDIYQLQADPTAGLLKSAALDTTYVDADADSIAIPVAVDVEQVVDAAPVEPEQPVTSGRGRRATAPAF
jgi:hypothetical protein